MIREKELSDSLVIDDEPESSRAILEAIDDAERAFDPYMAICRSIDRVYSLSTTAHSINVTDQTFALFWASMEILKPAIYAKPPKPIAQPRFKDGGDLDKTVADMLERSLDSSFERGDIDQVMLGVRDDLALTNRGVAWVVYETDAKGGGQRICIEHLDRADFLHEPARKWTEVGWVARRAWMTFTQMKKRFKKRTDDELRMAQFANRSERSDSTGDYGMQDSSAKCGVWEVWHRNDNRVYWVTPGVHCILEEGEPHLNLDGFFPCPRPAYGTIERRSLIPVPDYRRYQYHLDQINELTSRVYTLLSHVKLKVLIPAGGDIGTAVESALNSGDDSIIIPVPGAALSVSAGQNMFVTLPLQEIAMTITGLIEARGQLIEDFYQLSGISDIMRGATEAQETLGAQQLKTQYGSVRVRDKIDELQRMARDLARIAAEIMADNFSKDTFLDLSQMDIPSRSDIKKQISEVEKQAKEAMKAAAEQIQQAAGQQQEPVDPAQVQAQFQQQQQQIMGMASEEINRLSNTVIIEDVMDALRDTHARQLSIDIETDSTILTDEMAEKHNRAEFLQAITGAASGLQMFLAAGEPGRKLAGGLLKFAMQPYRANRALDTLIDEFVDTPMPADEGEGGDQEAMMQLAQAELMKAQAQGENYQAQAALKEQELQLKAAEAQAKSEQDQQKFMLSVQESEGKLAETQARIEKIYAEIQLAEQRLGLDAHAQEREDVKTVADIESRQIDQAMSAQNQQRQAMQSERQQEFSERSSERQLTLAERNAMNGGLE